MCGQLPPNHLRSMTVTAAPSDRALCVAASPPGPAPMTIRSKVESIASVCRARVAVALPSRFVEHDGRRGRDVQAVCDTEHRQADTADPRRAPRVRQAGRLASECEGDRTG